MTVSGFVSQDRSHLDKWSPASDTPIQEKRTHDGLESRHHRSALAKRKSGKLCVGFVDIATLALG